MNWLRKRWQAFLSWIGWPWTKRPAKPLGTVRTDDLPFVVNKEVVYLIGEGAYLWQAVMKCPCGCGETLQMNLMPEGRPRWRTTEHEDGTVSLHPSIWRTVGCRSHFFIRRGFVVWCETIPQTRHQREEDTMFQE